MQTSDQARTLPAQPGTRRRSHHGRWRFLRHYLEMVAWMRYRRHGWASTLEMVGAMFAPAIALIPLLWLGAIGGDALLMLEHLAMFVLMFLIMLRRRAEYGGAAHG